METVGERIRTRRHLMHMTQEELGRRVGVTKATINKYETGVVLNFRQVVIESLAAELQTTPSYLMGWDNSGVNINTVNGNNGIIGNNSGRANFNSSAANSKEEQELLRIFRALDVRDRIALLNQAFLLEEGSKK